MKKKNYLFSKTALLVSVFLCGVSNATTIDTQETTIKLFGHPCIIKGPFPPKTLKLIHEQSPEKILPVSSPQHAQEMLKKISEFSDLHKAFESYQQKLISHIKAQEAFLIGMQNVKEKKDTNELQKAILPHLIEAQKTKFLGFLKKFIETNKNPAKWSEEDTAKLEEAFLEASHPDPERDYHLAIKHLGIQYSCSFQGNLNTITEEDDNVVEVGANEGKKNKNHDKKKKVTKESKSK